MKEMFLHSVKVNNLRNVPREEHRCMANYYCPLNMFLCRIIRFLAKDKPPLKR